MPINLSSFIFVLSKTLGASAPLLASILNNLPSLLEKKFTGKIP
ncbi:hypothetical protein bwei_1885 [Bacillus mycoides]|nr:hypothetical protein bwei_1885 [Bacillus mycoides]EEL02899.1 hypothetical protein bcere0014_55550 [Bacillus cereus BDRD-ST196]